MRTGSLTDVIDVRPEVADAVAGGRPVVALESSLITHGFPYPTNFEVVSRMWNEIVAGGAIPAAIAVVDGVLSVGLSLDEIDALAARNDTIKVTRANLSYAVGANRYGGTTVTVTMMAAHAAGIDVFCTGGLGGVHRGAFGSGDGRLATLDVSADLEELSRTPVVIVSGGVKSILDVRLTLEYLETKGVPVVTLGAKEFPGFWSSSSGILSPLVADTIDDVVALVGAHRRMGLSAGIVVGVPVPSEFELPLAEAEKVIAQAVAEADDVHGADVTPWLLTRIVELTNGRSEAANKEELANNARHSAQVAVALAAAGAAQ